MAAMSAVRRRPNGLSPGLSMSLMAQIRSSHLSLALIVRSVQRKPSTWSTGGSWPQEVLAIRMRVIGNILFDRVDRAFDAASPFDLQCAAHLLGVDIEFATYPDPLPKISTMLRWMVATDGSSDSVNSCRASCHASNASRFFCQSG